MVHFMCGALSGVMAMISVYPMEVARTRMAMQGQLSHHTLTEIVKGTFQHEGKFAGLYKGGLASIMGTIVYKGAGFTLYELLKKTNTERFEKSLNFLHFSSAAVAAFFGQLGIHLLTKYHILLK